MDVQQSGEARVKKPPGPGGHGILVRAEEGQAIPFRPGPEYLGVGSGRGEVIQVEPSRVMEEELLDQPADFFFDRIPGKRRRGRCRGVAFPGQPVFPIEADLSPFGLSASHENPRLPAHVPVKGVHPPGGRFAGSGKKLVPG